MADETLYSLAPIYRSPPSVSPITAIAFSPDGMRLAYGDKSGRLVIIRNFLSSQARELDIAVGNVQIVVLRWRASSATNNGVDLIAGDSAGYIHVLPLASAAQRFAMRVHLSGVEDIAVDPEENLVGTASANEVRLWKVLGTGRFEPLPPPRLPDDLPPKGISSLGFGPSYVHVSDRSSAVHVFDKWTGILMDSTTAETPALGNAIWVGHSTPDNAPSFAYNDCTAGFVYQRGNKCIRMPYPHDGGGSAVLAVDSSHSELVGGGTCRRVLVFSLVSGMRTQHLSDNPTEAAGWIGSVAIKRTKTHAFIAAGTPVGSSNTSGAAGQFRVVVWAKVCRVHCGLRKVELLLLGMSAALATVTCYMLHRL